QPAPEDTIAAVRKPSPWDPKDLGPLMKELEELVPFLETPLVRAMVKAKNEGFPPNATGFKTLLVLTDGMDNRFERKEKKTGKVIGYDDVLQGIRKDTKLKSWVAKEFEKVGVVINFVGFKVEKGEAKDLQDQFKDTVESLDPKGNFYTTN